MAERLWALSDGIDDASQAKFARQMAAGMRSLRETSARSTASYLASAERTAGVAPFTGGSEAVREGLALVREGVPLEEVYSRPFVTSRVAISEGKTFAQAREMGLRRAVSMADTDVILAQNQTSRAYMQRSSRIVGYRRVPDAEACPLCLMASTQRYKHDMLQPIHNKCHCGIIPIIGSKDPGQVVNAGLLGKLKETLGSTTKPNPDSAYKKFVKVEDHGELGKVLSAKVPLPSE